MTYLFEFIKRLYCIIIFCFLMYNIGLPLGKSIRIATAIMLIIHYLENHSTLFKPKVTINIKREKQDD